MVLMHVIGICYKTLKEPGISANWHDEWDRQRAMAPANPLWAIFNKTYLNCNAGLHLNPEPVVCTAMCFGKHKYLI